MTSQLHAHKLDEWTGTWLGGKSANSEGDCERSAPSVFGKESVFEIQKPLVIADVAKLKVGSFQKSKNLSKKNRGANKEWTQNRIDAMDNKVESLLTMMVKRREKMEITDSEQHLSSLYSSEHEVVRYVAELKAEKQLLLQKLPSRKADLMPDVMKAAKKFVWMVPDHHSTNHRYGAKAFDKKIFKTVKGLWRKCKFEKLSVQSTVALVVPECVPGAGKTFAALTARRGFSELDVHKEYYFVSAYLGFEDILPLSDTEKGFLSQGGDVQLVFYLRFLVWLKCWNDTEELSGIDMNTWMQKQLKPRLWHWTTNEHGVRVAHPFDSLQLEHIQLSVLRAEIRLTLQSIAKRLGGKKLSILVVMDDASVLDDLCETRSTKGVNAALYGLRKLQYDMQGCAVVLPMCLGCRRLQHQPEANITVLNEHDFIMDMKTDWLAFSREHIRSVSEPQFVSYAMLAWPRVRSVLETHTVSSRGVDLLWHADHDTRLVLKTAADQRTLDITNMPRNLVTFSVSSTRAHPVVDFSTLGDFADRLGLALKDFQIPPIVTADMGIETWGGFVGVAFKTIAMFLSFFYHCTPDWRKYAPKANHTERLRNWLPEGRMNLKQVEYLSEGAIAHNALSQGFVDVLRKLTDRNDAILVHCGGDASLGIILVKRLCNRKLTLRFASTQYTSKRTAVASLQELDASRGNAVKTYRKLCKLLRSRNKSRIDKYNSKHMLHITNSLMLGEPPVDVMNPQNTTWFPMTHVLFSTPWSPKDIPTGLFLRNRPIPSLARARMAPIAIAASVTRWKASSFSILKLS